MYNYYHCNVLWLNLSNGLVWFLRYLVGLVVKYRNQNKALCRYRIFVDMKVESPVQEYNCEIIHNVKVSNSFPSEPLLILPPDATFWRLLHFPDDNFWRIVYSAMIWACLFCPYTTITAQEATCMLTIHDCIILKLYITWFSCIINKAKHTVDLPNFKMAARCTRCILCFISWVLDIILQTMM